MGGNNSKTEYKDINYCKSAKNVRTSPLTFSNLEFVRCILSTQEQYENNYHIPKSSLTVSFDSTLQNVENDIDNNIYNVYKKINEVSPSTISMKVLSPIYVAFSRKLEYSYSVFDNNNKFTIEVKKKEGYCIALQNYMENYINKSGDKALKDKYNSLPHTKYDFKGNLKVIIFFPFLTTQYKYITNFKDIINSSYYFLSLITKTEFNGITEVNTFDEAKIRQTHKNAPKEAIDMYINILKKQDNIKFTFRNDLINLCNQGGCLSESGGEDFKSLLPRLSDNDGDNINNALKVSPFLPSKCLSQTTRYKCGVEEVDKDKVKTPQDIVNSEKVITYLSDYMGDYIINEYCYTQKDKPGFDSDFCKGKPSNKVNMQQTPVDVINNVLNVFLKEQYDTNTNNNDKNHYSRDYSVNIIKELMLLNSVYPGIQEVVFPLYIYTKNSEYIESPPWGSKLLTPDKVITENEGININQKKYSFNDKYYLTVNEKGQVLVNNIDNTLYYYLSLLEITNPVSVALSLKISVSFKAPESGYIRVKDVLGDSKLKLIDKDKTKRAPFVFYLNNEGKLRVFANGFIDATDKSFIDYIDNKINEAKNGVSNANYYDRNNNYIGKTDEYGNLYEAPLYINKY